MWRMETIQIENQNSVAPEFNLFQLPIKTPWAQSSSRI